MQSFLRGTLERIWSCFVLFNATFSKAKSTAQRLLLQCICGGQATVCWQAPIALLFSIQCREVLELRKGLTVRDEKHESASDGGCGFALWGTRQWIF